MEEVPPHGILWAKFGHPKPDDPISYHPLLCHILDVAAVAECLWEEVLSPSARAAFARGLGLTDPDSTRRWVALLAGLHDLGKCCPTFQQRAGTQRLRALYDGALFALDPPELGAEAPHGVVTATTLGPILAQQTATPRNIAELLARVIGGHHGRFPDSGERRDLRRQRNGSYPLAVGNGSWNTLRQTVVAAAAATLLNGVAQAPAQIDDATVMALAQLTTVADWIGSMEPFFPYFVRKAGDRPPAIDPAAYYTASLRRAAEALDRLHWTGWTPPKTVRSFTSLFPQFPQPNDLQRRVERLADALAGQLPALIVVEAPMGEGKTEAALCAADRWGVNPGPRGLYVAMPTQATSNQMFARVRDFLRGRYPGETVNMQLLHGHADLSADLEAMRREWNPDSFVPAQICDDMVGSPGSGEAEVIAGSWFSQRKKGLLAPFAVGTIDQALMAVLSARHQFVRLGALGHKVIVFDEVHAYDTYMSSLLQALLTWLAALGAPVLLLSATLPATRRRDLVAAYSRGLRREPPPERTDVAYPRLTWVSTETDGAESVETSTRLRRELAFRWVDGDLPGAGRPFPLGEQLKAALEGGGCAAVICNTVARAQDVYEALRPYFPAIAEDGEPELILFHARYRFLERDQRERQVLRRFGKLGAKVEGADGGVRSVQRLRRAVLVATQVIEQSLDLDFDLMVSDLAPVDLLLQRSGRLHRHQRDVRPPGLREPSLWLCRPHIDVDGLPSFPRGRAAVYDAHALLRTWLVLRGCEIVRVPGEVEDLIEAVYDDRDCPAHLPTVLRELWWTTRQAHEQEMKEESQQAGVSRITLPFVKPIGDGVLEPNRIELVEDEPRLHPSLQARTRLDEPPVSVVLLRPDEEAKRKDLRRRAGRLALEETRYLIERSVAIRDGLLRRLVPGGNLALLQSVPGSTRSAILRGVKFMLLDETCVVTRPDVAFRLRYDETIGVVIERKEGEG